MKWSSALALSVVASSLFGLSTEANAASFFVTRDTKGFAANPGVVPPAMSKEVIDQLTAEGVDLPEVISVWTSFPMNGNNFATYIDPKGNDVTGIGFEDVFPPDGLKEPTKPPLRAVLWHNNFRVMDQRASLVGSPLLGYARYLFLLELSHLWGPDISLPEPGKSEAVGFPFHWSFLLSAGGSPAGGNSWIDNGDGSFTVSAADPATLGYSLLDLYLMGLATPDEVPPFFVISQPVFPATPSDPLWGGSFSAKSFPWFVAGQDFTVSGVRRDLTVDDVIAANGERTPAAMTKTAWSFAVVLMVPNETTDEEIATLSEEFEPLAASLAPAFAEATSGRGALDLVLPADPPSQGGSGAGTGGGAAAGGGSGGGGASSNPADDGCSCRTTGTNEESDGGLASLAIALSCFVRTRRKRAR